jgi:hypothetical protein
MALGDIFNKVEDTVSNVAETLFGGIFGNEPGKSGNISDFKSSFKVDVARPNRFDVEVPVPITLIPFRGMSRILKMRCENAELPSRTFATADRKIGANPVEKFPYQPNYNDVTLTFIVDDDMETKIFFDTWQEFINPTYSFNFTYKLDYVTNVVINQYDVHNKVTYSINLIDAYPISVNQLDLDWSADGHHKLTVVFAYSYWINNSVQALGNSLLLSVISRITSALGGLGSLGTFGDEADLDNPFSTIGNDIFGRDGRDPSYNGSDYGSEDSGFFSWFGADDEPNPLIITNDDEGFALPGVGRQDGIYTDPYDRGIYWG